VRCFTTEEFIAKADKVHRGRYDYSQTTYQNSWTPVTIICGIHHAFSQIPDNHLRGKGCKHCAGNQSRPVEEIIKAFRTIHGDRYEYDLTTLTSNKRRIKAKCHLHGPFEVSFCQHRRGAGCSQCTGHYHHQAGKHFVRRANAIHDSKYSYGKYTAASHKIAIRCPVHGPFFQTPASHLQGHGCKSCADDQKRLLAKGGYSEEFFRLHPEMKQHSGFFYVVEFNRQDESFLKVGITKTSVKNRFKSGYRKYHLRVAVTKKLALYAAFQLEQAVLEAFRPRFQKFPRQHQFTGKTECLAISSLADVMSWLKEKRH